MISRNSGSDTETEGSAELKGSKDTVTKCRLATANTTNIRANGMTIKARRNFRMTIARVEPNRSSLVVRGARFGIIAVQSLAHFLARLKERDTFLIDRNMRARPRIAPGACRAVLDRKRAEAAQLDPVAPRQRSNNLIEDRIHDILDIPLIEVRVMLGDTLNQFGFDHREVVPDNNIGPFP